VILSNPKKIPGLTLWVDAADDSTVNNGRVTNGQNVFKIVDKVGGLTFRNGYGSAGPSYSVGVVNGKNAITFNYYTQSLIDSIQAKGLWAGNVTTMASATYSLYSVSFPYDIRQRTTDGGGSFSTQRLYLLSLINNLAPTGLNSYSPNLQINFFGPGPPASPLNNLSAFITEDNDFIQTTGNARMVDRSTSFSGYLNSSLSDTKYVYGKANVMGLRMRTNSTTGPGSGMRKLTVMRKDHNYKNNFQLRLNVTTQGGVTGSYGGFIPASGGPWLTIGGIVPNASTRVVEGVFGPIPTEYPMGVGIVLGQLTTASNVWPFEGHFCELLYFNRALSDSESNSVEQYLKKKWAG